MQRIHDIFIAFQRICRRNIHILRPVRRPHQDNRIFINLTYFLYDSFCIGLYLPPVRASIRLVADFVNDIFIRLVFFRHLLKKSKRLLFVSIRIPIAQYMPVNNHIHPQIRSRFYPGMDKLLQSLSVSGVSGAVAVVFCCIHSQPDGIRPPRVAQILKRLLRYILRKPGQPVSADAFQLKYFSFRIHQIRSLHRQPAVGANWRGGRNSAW